MSLRRFAILSLVATLALPSAAFAQDIDDLLGPSETKPTKPKGTKTKPAKPPKPTAKRKTPPKKEKLGARKGKAGKNAATATAEDTAPAKATLALKLGSNARGAKVTVDGQEVNPQTPLELAPGEHTVVARRQNYADFIQQVTLAPGLATELIIALDAATGFATLRADVPRVVVFVDGNRVGPAPIENYPLSQGQHEIEFRGPGLKDVKNINVRAGQLYVVEGRLRPSSDTPTAVAQADDVPRSTLLEPSKPAGPQVDQPGLALGTEQPPEVKESTSKAWYQKWYVWVGVGVVAAAAGAGAYAVTRGPAELTPNEVCGGTCDGDIGFSGLRPAMPANGVRF
ncbi:PEGA domain-containing protein [Corallococcus sp. AB011P]|uniref:PEGA domain-containing protein n=1 Tax=unclassified Corallococcus TaxID=2685029 RepID=UPI000EA2F87F|nr:MULTISPECIES: PEGA domain-containing protein [unclassified Corallococcus]RKG54181.1 PEGA domain-containing protein [Corallococcus sp. AB011P]RKH76688.1 PEGA domain-containing protein [Corallococcus sp. AB045]